MIVSFPYTNPIVFSIRDAYHNYQDAYRHEQNGCFIQPFAKGDLISFQLQWTGRRKSTTHTLKIELVINGKRTQYRTYTLLGVVTCGTLYNSYCKQELYNYFYVKGYYVFCNKTEGVADAQGTSLLHTGDKFYFVVTADGVEYESNTLQYVSDTSESKLLHYNNTTSVVFDTVFRAVAKGYDIRLPGTFLHPKPGASKEVFESYGRDLELITAQPYENIELEIGKTRGIPDWWIKRLNYIFHCDLKSIDGIDYELTSNAAIEPEYTQGYNFAWLKIEMAPKKNSMSYLIGATDRNVLGGTVIQPFVTSHKVPSVETATIGIVGSGHWYLGDGGTGLLTELEVSQIAGNDEARIDITAKHNLSDKEKSMTLYLYDAQTNTVIDSITLLQKCCKQGISYGSVGDTLFVYEKTLIN